MAGYSGTPLAKKLGIGGQERLTVLAAPWDYATTVGVDSSIFRIASRLSKSELFVHLFAKQVSELVAFGRIAAALADSGMVWVSWPKKSSGVETELTEELVRQAGLHAGLVDVKVCAIDETWSGLKFVRRLKDRGSR
jgi:hypothetical protein